MASYLIGYKDPRKNKGHEDPMLHEFTYGDMGGNGRKLQAMKKGDYIFFHKTVYDKRYITAYYLIEEVHLVKDVLKDQLIIEKYKNHHLQNKNINELAQDETIVFGDPIRSKVLGVPLEITEKLLSELSRPAKLNPNQSLLAAMSSSLRTWKKLNKTDIRMLNNLINDNEYEGRLQHTLLATEEVSQILEADIEKFIANNPEFIAKGFTEVKQQHIFNNGTRLDLLLKNPKTGEGIVVEVKKGRVGREAKKQIKGYMKLCEKELGCSNPIGIIVCVGILPYFEEEMVKAKKDNIFVKKYGWKLDFS